MKIRIIIPTLFHLDFTHTYEYSRRLDVLKKQLSNYDYDIVMVCNWKKNKDKFLNWKYDGIIKKYSEDEFNIGKAVNMGLDLESNADYYCFFSDDIVIQEDNWVKKFIDLYNPICSGLLGIKGHTNSKIKEFDDVVQHSHVDGLMFFSKERLKEIGKFSEQYHYDCECQDYCLTMILHGYKNYAVKLNYIHFSSSPIVERSKISRVISRRKLEKKWETLDKLHKDKDLKVHGLSYSGNNRIDKYIPFMKNLIYIVTIDHPSSTYKNSDYSQYCLNTWKYWCEKNDVDLQIITEHDERFGKPIWNKELIYERAEGYDKIGIVDSDTMVRWDSPNPFDLFEEEFCGVNDIANMKWMDDSIKVYGKFFPDLEIEYYQYVNAGVLFFHKKHLYLFKQILDFYLDNQEELDNWNKGGGKEQTILNYHLVKNNITPKLLPPTWNLFSIHKKEMFNGNWQIPEDPTPFFIKYGNIWHFTGISLQDRIDLMKITWERFGDRYV